MRLIAYFFQGERMAIALALLTSIVSGMSSAALIGTLSQQLHKIHLLTVTSVATYVSLMVLAVATNLLAKKMFVRLTTQHTYSLRMELARRILATPFVQIESIGSPRLFAALTEDARTISSALSLVPAFFINVAIVSGCLLYLAWLSPLALFALCLLSLPIYCIYRRLHTKAVRLLHHLFRLRDQRFEQYEAMTAGIKELQMNAQRRNKFILHHLEPTAHAFRQGQIDVQMAHEIANSWSQSAYFIFILALLLLVASTMIEMQILGAFAFIALYMRNAVNQLLQVIPQWTQADTALRTIDSLELANLSHSALSCDGHKPESAVVTPLCIKLSGVKHSYIHESNDQPFSLGPLDLELRSGELVFITGANGSGKTTLLKVLTALYLPEDGQITLHDIPLSAHNVAWYRQHFSVVFADCYLFEDLLGPDGLACDEHANDYLAQLQLDRKVTIQDGHLSTVNLSSGQRKRLALLAAYLEDRPIYIFDEWAASQDPVFKEIFYRQLLPELKHKGKLVIVISHDDHYYDVADRIIKLNYGQIEEDTWSKSTV